MSILHERRPAVMAAAWPKFHGTNRTRLLATLLVVDAAVIIVATGLAVVLHHVLPLNPAPTMAEHVDRAIPEIALGWLLMLVLSGAYSYRRLGAGLVEYHRVLLGSFAACAGAGMVAYLTSLDLSQVFFLLMFAIGIPMLVAGRLTVRRFTNAARARGLLFTSTLLAGRPGHVADVLQVLRRERWLGYRVEGLLLPRDSIDPSYGEIPVLGTPDQAVQAIRQTGARAVIFADGSFERASEFNLVARELENLDAQTIVVPALADVCAARLMTRPVAGIPLVFVERPHASLAVSWAKRVFDIVGSSLLLLFFAPVLAVTAALVRLGDGGPAFFRQVRVGKRGELFNCYKLRSMVVNAEQLVAELAARSDGNGVLFKMTDDPRVTPVGRIIRRYSLDEVPQLLNVLKGEMSLIGPRPALPSEVDCYEEHVRRRLAVRPGMTGLWQVSGRSRLSWDETVRLDLYYVDNWSMVQDLRILMRTFGAVLRPSGAY